MAKMATADQIKALIKSFNEDDKNRFFTIAMQVAAKEEKRGHQKLASDIRELLQAGDSYGLRGSQTAKFRQIRSRKSNSKDLEIDSSSLLHLTNADTRLSQLVLDQECSEHISRAVQEYRQKDRLAQYALQPRRKLLLVGPPGTGKTLTAKVLATELQLPLYVLQFDGLISRYLGETAAKLRVVFNHIATSRAVYLFDEFDAIGSHRSNDNDVGEIRRVLNSFLQFFEEDSSESVIVCATNHPELLDKALFRRFDDIIEFRRPKAEQIIRFVKNRLFMFDLDSVNLEEIAGSIEGLSYADLGQACDDAAKSSVLNNRSIVTDDALISAVRRRTR